MKGSEAFMSKINTGGQDQLSNIDDAKKEADEAAGMTANLESLTYEETSSDVVAEFAQRLRRAQETPDQIFERTFDLALQTTQPDQGGVQYYQVYGKQLAGAFIDSLVGLDTEECKKELERTWVGYLCRTDNGYDFEFEDNELPPWLRGKLEQLREQLGTEYSVDLVATREAGKPMSALTIDLRIEHKGFAPAVSQPGEEAPKDTTANMAVPANSSNWEAEEDTLRSKGFTPLEISIEKELRQAFDVSTVVEEFKKVRQERLGMKSIYKNILGDIDMGQIRLAGLDIAPPATDKRIIWGSRLAMGTFIWAGFGFATSFSPVGITAATCLTPPAFIIGNAVAELATSSKKANFQPWNKSPHLIELFERLEAEGFKCALSCSLNYPKILFLSVSCRDPEASMGNKKLRLRT